MIRANKSKTEIFRKGRVLQSMRAYDVEDFEIEEGCKIFVMAMGLSGSGKCNGNSVLLNLVWIGTNFREIFILMDKIFLL